MFSSRLKSRWTLDWKYFHEIIISIAFFDPQPLKFAEPALEPGNDLEFANSASFQLVFRETWFLWTVLRPSFVVVHRPAHPIHLKNKTNLTHLLAPQNTLLSVLVSYIIGRQREKFAHCENPRQKKLHHNNSRIRNRQRMMEAKFASTQLSGLLKVLFKKHRPLRRAEICASMRA